MSEFWTSQDLVSWKHCYCGNDCLSNCVGMPTFRGVILFLSVIVLITFFVWVFSVINTTNKIGRNKHE